MKKLLKQQGSSLLYVILLLGIMLIISFSMAVLSISEFQTTGVNQRSQKAFYVAEAGIERSLFELSKDPTAASASTNPVVVTPGGDSYKYCYGDCGTAQAPSTQEVVYTLNANESKKVYLFRPDKLQLGPTTQSGTTVDFQCMSCFTGETPVPALEVTLYSFDPATISSFNLNKLQQSNLNSSMQSLQDESGITIDTHYYEDMRAHAQSPTTDALSVSGTNPVNGNNMLYMVELHALNTGETYSVKFSHPLTQDIVPTIQSFGEVKNAGPTGDARRGISLTYSTTKDSLDIFNYTLFENTPIEKFAR